MSSQRSWTVAQEMCARLWVQIGMAHVVITAGGYVALDASGNRDADTWWWFALLFAVLPLPGILWSMFLVERRLQALDASEPREE